MLSADDLGEKGESRFKELCADAGLICNKSDRDRAGWDFIVEYHFDKEKTATLDKREAPPSCHIQVKTINSSTKRVRMKLNMAERLAKELKPAFVCVIVVNDANEVEAIYLVHIIDERLAYILRKLREHEVDPNGGEINKVSISIQPRASERVEVSGEALKTALSNACGRSLYEYSEKKKNQVKSLGFEKQAIRVKFQLKNRPGDEMEDVYLGLVTQVPVASIDVFEKRFGIEMHELKSAQGLISISPEPTDTCRILLRRPNLALLAMDANIYQVPRLLSGHAMRVHIKGEFLRIDLFRTAEETRAEFSFESSNFRAPVQTWTNYWGFAAAFREAESLLEIHPKSSLAHFSLPIKNTQADPEPMINRWIALTSALSCFYESSGMSPDYPYTCAELGPAESDLALVSRLIAEPSFRFKFPIDHAHPLIQLASDPIPALMCQYMKIGEMVIAYHFCARVSVVEAEDGTEGVISDFSFRGARRISADPAEFEAYQAAAQRMEKIDVVMRLKLDAKFISD